MITPPASLLTAGLVGAVLLSSSGLAQESQEEMTALERASRTFAAADLDRDGLIEPEEMKQASIPSSVLKTWDEDASSSLSKDEFLGYYRRLMVNAGLTPGAELDAEVKRIEADQAARKERAARQRAQEAQKEQETKTAGESGGGASGRPTPPAAPSGGESTRAKYERAQAALNERLRAARASREVASEEQKALLERARASSGAGSSSGSSLGASETARERLARAQAALEGRARGSNATREQLARAQARLEDRAKRKVGAEGSESQAEAADASADLRSKLDRANAELTKRAQSGDMTREQQQALQEALKDRARNAAGGGPATDVRATPAAGSLESRSSRSEELAGVPATDREKVGRALDAMEARAKAGNWSREKLAAEKADLIARAKGAQDAASTSGIAPTGETPEQRKAREARKRAAEGQKPQPTGETPEQRKAREARKRAAEAEKPSPSKPERAQPKTGAGAGGGKSGAQQRPAAKPPGRGRGGQR